MRVQVNKLCNWDVYSEYQLSQRCYNAFSDEWDFCHEFHFGLDKGYNSDSDSDDYFTNDKECNNTIKDGHDDIADGDEVISCWV